MLLFWILIILLVIILILVLVFVSLGGESALTLCQAQELKTPEENWLAYQNDPTITKNPFFLVGETREGQLDLHMTNVSNTDCIACGSTLIPFPKFCQVSSRFTSTEYELTDQMTTEGTREYISNSEIISLGPSCQTPIGSGLTGTPLTRWS